MTGRSRNRETFISELQDRFIDMLRASRWLEAAGFEEAFRSVPRHLFVDRYHEWTGQEWRLVNVTAARPTTAQLRRIYENDALTTDLGPAAVSSISQPSLVAQMMTQLQLAPGMNVLEIGAGTGWNAGLISWIVGPEGQVSSVELHSSVARRARRNLRRVAAGNVLIVTGEGAEGYAPAAPYDRIITTVGCPDVFPEWIDQLKDGGMLLITLQAMPHGQVCLLSRLWKRDGRLEGTVLGTPAFVVFQGRHGLDADVAGQLQERLNQVKALPLRRQRLAPWVCMNPAARSHRRGDLLFMAYLEGMTVEPVGKYVTVSSVHCEGVCVTDEEHVQVYGNEDMYEAFEAVSQRWISLGAPARHEYLLEVWPKTATKPTAENGWLVQRDHSQLVFKLRRNALAKTGV